MNTYQKVIAIFQYLIADDFVSTDKVRKEINDTDNAFYIFIDDMVYPIIKIYENNTNVSVI